MKTIESFQSQKEQETRDLNAVEKAIIASDLSEETKNKALELTSQAKAVVCLQRDKIVEDLEGLKFEHATLALDAKEILDSSSISALSNAVSNKLTPMIIAAKAETGVVIWQQNMKKTSPESIEGMIETSHLMVETLTELVKLIEAAQTVTTEEVREKQSGEPTGEKAPEEEVYAMTPGPEAPVEENSTTANEPELPSPAAPTEPSAPVEEPKSPTEPEI